MECKNKAKTKGTKQQQTHRTQKWTTGYQRERGTLLHWWWECKLVEPLWKPIWRFLKKLKIEIPFDPGIPLLGIYPKKTESQIQKDICTPMFTAALFTIAKKWKQPKCPSVDAWIKKWYIYTMEYYSALRRKQILPFAAAWMGAGGCYAQ